MSLRHIATLGWLLVLMPTALYAQQTTFIMHFDSVQNGRQGSARDVEETPDGYLVGGRQTSPGPFHRGHAFFRAIDHEGNVLSDREYWYADPRDVDPGYGWDQLVRVNDTVYVGPMDLQNPNAPLEKTLLWASYSMLGDSLSMKEMFHSDIMDSVLFSGIRQCAVVDAAGGVAFCGDLSRHTDVMPQGWLIRCDPQGDTLWTQRVGPPDHYVSLYSIDGYFADNGMVVCGTEVEIGAIPEYVLFRTDSMGNILWRVNFGGQGGGVSTVRSAPDGTILTWTATRNLPNHPSSHGYLELRKWDANGGLIWSSPSELITEFHAPYNMEVLDDGSVICTSLSLGWAGLRKFSALGDSLWMRQYAVFSGLGAGFSNAYDVEPTSDGGFIFCGQSQQGNADPTPNLPTWFVVKTDSLGCVVPGCHLVGVEEYEIALQNALLIWPNPAAFRLQAELELPAGYPLSGAVTAQLLDLQGREVRRWPTELRGGRVSLSTTDLPAPGAYVLHLTDARRWLAGGKVVVE